MTQPETQSCHTLTHMEGGALALLSSVGDLGSTSGSKHPLNLVLRTWAHIKAAVTHSSLIFVLKHEPREDSGSTPSW